jgi:predicted adenylyl cyclase CyaB
VVGIRSSAQAIQHQKDTYFHVPHGRLKLREIKNRAATLIWYDRPDDSQARLSRYVITPVADAEAMSQVLSLALGVHRVVEKERHIMLYRNVRLHFDRVAGLGDFIEFEAVLSPEEPESSGHDLLIELRDRFAITDADIFQGSYEGMSPNR